MSESTAKRALEAAKGLQAKMRAKRCPKCRLVYPATTRYFCRNKAKKDGLGVHCKTCARQFALASYYRRKAALKDGYHE